MYPTGCVPPSFMGSPESTNHQGLLCPGVDTYGVAKELAKFLKPLVGKSPHHINSTNDFVEQVKQLTLALYLLCSPQSQWIQPWGLLRIYLKKTPPSRIEQYFQFMTLFYYWNFVLKTCNFSFQDQFYEQIEGVAKVSPASPIVTKLYMEYFEQKVLSTAPTPRLWQRYVDDTFVIQKEVNKQDFLQHINSVNPTIQFTVENNKEDGAIPFLDPIDKPEAYGNLSITVYRKPTHTDQYLQWDSHHNLSAKFSVINTLIHRAKTVCSNPELLHKEMHHLRKVLTQCE